MGHRHMESRMSHVTTSRSCGTERSARFPLPALRRPRRVCHEGFLSVVEHGQKVKMMRKRRWAGLEFGRRYPWVAEP